MRRWGGMDGVSFDVGALSRIGALLDRGPPVLRECCVLCSRRRPLHIRLGILKIGRFDESINDQSHVVVPCVAKKRRSIKCPLPTARVLPEIISSPPPPAQPAARRDARQTLADRDGSGLNKDGREGRTRGCMGGQERDQETERHQQQPPLETSLLQYPLQATSLQSIDEEEQL